MVIQVLVEVVVVELLRVQVLYATVDLLALDVLLIFFDEYLVVLLLPIFLLHFQVDFSRSVPRFQRDRSLDVGVNLGRPLLVKHILDVGQVGDPRLRVPLYFLELLA